MLLVENYEELMDAIGRRVPSVVQLLDGSRVVPEVDESATRVSADVVFCDAGLLLVTNRRGFVAATKKLLHDGVPFVSVIYDGIQEPTSGIRWMRQS